MAEERATPEGPGADEADLRELRRLRRILDRHRTPGRMEATELLDLPRLYRHACSVALRLESAGRRTAVARETRSLIARAHALLYDRRADDAADPWARLARLLLVDAPRAVRAEWRLLAVSFFAIYGLATVAWIAVSRDLDLAPSLLDPAQVQAQMEQLAELEPGEEFRGNFTFGWGESPTTAGMVTLNNIGVGILFFASALIPPLYAYILSTNALMLGTYIGVAGHWGQGGSISSILWCHGVLEIQAIVLAGTAGLCLVRAWIRPGAWTRRYALQLESRRALQLLAPTVPMLVVAGLVEGFVSPHSPLAVRVAVAAVSGLALVLWALLGGRGASDAVLAPPPPSR